MNERGKKTKIVATIGPACDTKEKLRALMEAGVDVMRINFSHGDHQSHGAVIKMINELNAERNAHTAILADLQGPKLRIGEVAEGLILQTGDTTAVTTRKELSRGGLLSVNYSGLVDDVQPGEKILINDGKVILTVTGKKDERTILTEVIQGGALSSNKGFNLPNTALSLPCLTDKDLKDLAFILKQDISWIGLSFVRSAKDIITLKQKIKKAGSNAKVVAKIEKPEAIKALDDIISVSDATMVARGDLGVEIPLEEIPLVQKRIIISCRKMARPVIIATQMMESMIDSLKPTRAEVSDVATSVLDGADAVMLSGETSVGNHPVEVVETMARIIVEAEKDDDIYFKRFPDPVQKNDRNITDAICASAISLCRISDAKAIITNTFSGYTGFKLASYRPNAAVFVFTANKRILDMLSLLWGVRGFYYNEFTSTDKTIDDIKSILLKRGLIAKGDYVVNITSMPIANKGMSNMVKLSTV